MTYLLAGFFTAILLGSAVGFIQRAQKTRQSLRNSQDAIERIVHGLAERMNNAFIIACEQNANLWQDFFVSGKLLRFSHVSIEHKVIDDNGCGLVEVILIPEKMEQEAILVYSVEIDLYATEQFRFRPTSGEATTTSIVFFDQAMEIAEKHLERFTLESILPHCSVTRQQLCSAA